ncbi:MAG: PhnD/SsuA/transferrin family substrate-binding protein [Rhizobiaceae bacterium]|nr:PhnD/SsuA/transferrin family substrate-binding protein [Rhizobiaceae bacterium]MCV0405032.1 PhnD/SsuA/transferrin family substrate-binding protein [Rhizobiaceae bacterium]
MRSVVLPVLFSLAVSVSPAMATDEPANSDGGGSFRVGLVERDDLDETTLGAVRDALSRALGLKIEIVLARDQTAMIDAAAAGQVDYGVYSALAYATAWRLCACMEPLLAPLGADGSAGIRAVLIEEVDAAEERLIAVMAEYSVPTAHPGKIDMGPEWTIVETTSMEKAERLFADGEAGALSGWEAVDEKGEAIAGGTLARLAAAGIDGSRLRVVRRSDPVPYGPHAVRRTLPGQVKKALGEFLVSLGEDHTRLRDALEPRLTGPFRPVVHDDYRHAIDAVKSIAERDG